jgi:hypothetical protein
MIKQVSTENILSFCGQRFQSNQLSIYMRLREGLNSNYTQDTSCCPTDRASTAITLKTPHAALQTGPQQRSHSTLEKPRVTR